MAEIPTTREQRIEIAAKAMWDGLRSDPRFQVGPWELVGQDDHARQSWRWHATHAVDALFPEAAENAG